MKTWTVTLETDEETGELILPLGEEVLDGLDWKIGDTIEWIDNKDGSWTMRKKEETELVLVECISQFRERYLVEVPVGKSEWALDTVVCNDAQEFSQEHLGETIVSHRVVSKDEALELCDKDNGYAKAWTEEQKLLAFMTPWVDKPL
jgi:hypothetical protein